MLNVIIDGKEYSVHEGATILDVCRKNNIYVPTLCYLKRVGSIGTCRMCLVEVKGIKIPIASCTTKVKDGMVIKTSSERLESLRRENLKLLLAYQPVSTLIEEDNELTELIYRYGITHTEITEYCTNPIKYKKAHHPSPVLRYIPQRCILCGRCIEACTEVIRIGALTYDGKGASAVINAQKETIFYKPQCISCGECSSVCPVNAIEFKMQKHTITKGVPQKIETICSYCGVGCTIVYKVLDNEIIGVEKKNEKGVNKGSLCVKGRFGYDYATSSDRLKEPLKRVGDKFVPISWEEAYDIIRVKLLDIKSKYGPDAIMGLSSAKCRNEDNYLFQKFFRAAIGTNNVDHCARLCHSSTVAGLAATLGAGAMTNSIDDMTKADVIFVIGSNTTEAHPVIGMMIKRSVDEKGAKLIVADPRKIELTNFAYQWLRHRPGTDIALLNGIAHVIYEKGLWNREFVERNTENFEEYIETIKKYDPESVSKICGITVEDLYKAAETIGTQKNVSFVYAMGITQHKRGSDTVKAVSNLALLTGNIGKERSGVNPLRGQNNVQGACDMGCLPNVLPGYQKVTNKDVRNLFEVVWGINSLPDTPGLEASLLTHAIEEGKIRALYIMGENPVITEADTNAFREALKKLDFLVVQDIFLSDTARYAHIILPAASNFEVCGTVTNTERRVQLVRKVIEPIGNVRPDWVIIKDLLTRCGIKANYNDVEDVFNEIRQVVPQYRGITYERLRRGGIQWPCPHEDHPGTKFLYRDGFATENKKAKFIPTEQPSYDEEAKGFEFILTTGRSLYHYHTGTMSRRSVALDLIYPEGYICVNPEDAKELGVQDGMKIRLRSKVSEIEAPVKVSDMVPKKVVFSTFHFKEIPINSIIPEHLDPICKIPEFKVVPVNVEKV